MHIDARAVDIVAQHVLGWPSNKKWHTKDKEARLRSLFGAPTDVIATLWNKIVDASELESGAKPKHLLWALVQLKVCSTTEVHCSIVGWPSRTTFAKWAWYFIEKICGIRHTVMKLEDRFEGLGSVAEANCFMSVDGTDCPVFEPFPFSRSMFSQKLNGPALKYEVGVCLKTGKPVWIHGPFEGSTNDGTMLRNRSSSILFADEAAEVDKGCTGDDKMKRPDMGETSQQRKMKSNARAQHEIVNGRLKQFNALTTHFRHLKPNKEGMMIKHGMCFKAVAVMTQLKFPAGEKVFDAGLDCNVECFWMPSKQKRCC